MEVGTHTPRLLLMMLMLLLMMMMLAVLLLLLLLLVQLVMLLVLLVAKHGILVLSTRELLRRSHLLLSERVRVRMLLVPSRGAHLARVSLALGALQCREGRETRLRRRVRHLRLEG